MAQFSFTRHHILAAGSAVLLTSAILRGEPGDLAPVRCNASNSQSQNWQDHFVELGAVAIVADTTSRALHFWSGGRETHKTTQPPHCAAMDLP